MKKSIIFDLDGTLWDTTVQVNEVWNKIAKKYNLEISSERIKDISKVLGHSRIETTKNYYINCTKDNLKGVSKSFEKELGLNLED